MPWSATTAPTWTLTRTKRAPVAAATASAERASVFSTLTPSGRRTARRISAIAAAIAATVPASTGPALNGTSPWFSTRRASAPPVSSARASATAASAIRAMSPPKRGLPGNARRWTMPMTARGTPRIASSPILAES